MSSANINAPEVTECSRCGIEIDDDSNPDICMEW